VAEIVAQITGIAGVALPELGRDGQSQVPDLSSASLLWTKSVSGPDTRLNTCA